MPETVRSLFPTAKELLDVDPETLAPILLRLARDHRQGPIAMFLPGSVMQDTAHLLSGDPENSYPYHQKAAVEALVNEAWNLLRTDGLVASAPGINGQNGWLVLTGAGEQVSASTEAYGRVRALKAFPKSLLHPNISEAASSALWRGDLDEAVFKSFRAVEEAVREAGKFAATDRGVTLMRKAFDPKSGPLTNMSDPEPEREALAHLFAGAIGSYQNPHSHRTVKLTDPREAQEQVTLATHLLRIVDSRRPK